MTWKTHDMNVVEQHEVKKFSVVHMRAMSVEQQQVWQSILWHKLCKLLAHSTNVSVFIHPLSDIRMTVPEGEPTAQSGFIRFPLKITSKGA